MDLIEKLEQIEINPRYDMTAFELDEIANSFICTYDAAAYGFRCGYLKGQRAQKKAEQKSGVPEHPKYKTEYRRAIIKKVGESKNIIGLKTIYRIIDMMNRCRDEKLYETLTDGEWSTISIINSILVCEDEVKLNQICSFISNFLYPRKEHHHD